MKKLRPKPRVRVTYEANRLSPDYMVSMYEKLEPTKGHATKSERFDTNIEDKTRGGERNEKC